MKEPQKSELARYFMDLRKERKLTQVECSRKANLSQWSVTKIESNKPVKVDTLKELAKRGLSLDEGSKEYRRLMSLWSVHRGAFDTTAVASRHAAGAKSSKDAKFQRFIDQIATALSGLAPENYEIFAEALGNPDIQEIIPQLHRTFGPKVEE